MIAKDKMMCDVCSLYGSKSNVTTSFYDLCKHIDVDYSIIETRYYEVMSKGNRVQTNTDD